jgi:molybdate-binding protein/DNA-binding XRE family transcriptional regulator
MLVVMNSSNRVRERREVRGLSQIELGQAAGLSRQSIGAIEAGRTMPSVDVALRLASALDCRVEDLFGTGGAGDRLRAEPLGEPLGGRVALAQIAGRFVSYPLAASALSTSADGIVQCVLRGSLEVDPLRSRADIRENVVLMGCAPALGLLADRLNSRAGRGRFLWVGGSSTRALEALKTRRTHVAGVHLVDDRTGEANVADVRRHVGSEPVAVVTLARWEAGLVTARGNPQRISGVSDLGRPALRLVARERGSGARRLLERELLRAGLSRNAARAAPVKATGHLEVAHAVSLGAADVGVATQDAALGFGLGFVPLREERYDLAIPRSALEDPRLSRLFDVLRSGTFRRELASLGYDASASGDQVAEIDAA